jgi:hypothetical protein
MTTDRLDRIDLLLHQAEWLTTPDVRDLLEIIQLMSEELRYLHGRPPEKQTLDALEMQEKTN